MRLTKAGRARLPSPLPASHQAPNPAPPPPLPSPGNHPVSPCQARPACQEAVRSAVSEFSPEGQRQQVLLLLFFNRQVSDPRGGRALGVVSRDRPKQIGDPRGGWVGQRPKKNQGQIHFLDISFSTFLNSPHRETHKKNVIKEIRNKSVLGFCRFFLTTFRHEFFVKRFV
jgi:hypothetical protein